ncbi:MAG: hypothetical protein H8D23_39635 [Candidatus Brocadiales bacterium]|nr:hypothetical protein [Candidatus Brocadiales bacterium]
MPKTLVEGSHKVKFVLIDMAGNEMQQVFECIIDNTPPVISSVWPSSILNKENAKFSKVLVEVKDAVSGLNVEECAVRIDGVMIGKAAVNEKGLEFPVKNVLKEGVHKIEITVLDNAGNGLNHVTKFSIDKTPPIIESISPDNGAILKKKEFPIVTIKANDPVSGVDLLRCRVILDDKVLELRSGNENEFIFAANYELDEGLHNLKAMIFDKAGNSVEHESSFSIIVEEAVVEEAVAGNEVIEDETDKVVEIADKDDIESVVAEPVEKDKADIEPVKGFDIAAIKEPPVIRSVFPANGICVNNRDLLSVVVEIESPVENLDLEKCEVILSGQSILKPIVFNDLLLFEIVNRIGQGEHKIKAIIFDLAGHKVENSSEFKVMSLPGNNKSCDERFGAVTEKMAGDKRFIKNLLMNFSDTVADEGLHSTKEMAIFQPPSISEAHADFMIENDNENVVEVRRTVAGKIKEALLKEMPSHLAKLNEDGALTKEGKLTECARETICAILQDPVNAIENIGVDLNEGEKKTIFPSFSRENAEELINWISVVHSR